MDGVRIGNCIEDFFLQEYFKDSKLEQSEGAQKIPAQDHSMTSHHLLGQYRLHFR